MTDTTMLHTNTWRNEAEIAALAARVARLQRLWQAWGAAQGYALTSKRWTAFAAALKACEDAGDLLPVEDGTA